MWSIKYRGVVIDKKVNLNFVFFKQMKAHYSATKAETARWQQIKLKFNYNSSLKYLIPLKKVNISLEN